MSVSKSQLETIGNHSAWAAGSLFPRVLALQDRGVAPVQPMGSTSSCHAEAEIIPWGSLKQLLKRRPPPRPGPGKMDEL